MTLRKVRRTRLHDLRKSDQPLTLVAACCCKSAGCMTLQNPPSGGCMSLQTGTRRITFLARGTRGLVHAKDGVTPDLCPSGTTA
jgi:hypothetical protein